MAAESSQMLFAERGENGIISGTSRILGLYSIRYKIEET